MTTTPRAYHHGNLRAALVEAGLELTRTGGPGALVLRDVTRQVGVSPNAAYRHFADRQSLLAAVGQVIQERMATRMRDHEPLLGLDLDAAQRARGGLRAVGLGYIEFALAEPGWFETAFFPPRSLRPLTVARPPETALPPPFALLVDALDRLVDAGVLSDAARVGAEWPCWAAVHGFAELALQGPLRGAPPEVVRRSAERTLDAIIAGVTG